MPPLDAVNGLCVANDRQPADKCRRIEHSTAFYVKDDMMNKEEVKDEFDEDLDDLFAQFEGVSVEGGFDPETSEDDGCAGGACKI
nr:MAG TPA: hypothetical protein [Caudoviricetes sp.]